MLGGHLLKPRVRFVHVADVRLVSLAGEEGDDMELWLLCEERRDGQHEYET